MLIAWTEHSYWGLLLFSAV